MLRRSGILITTFISLIFVAPFAIASEQVGLLRSQQAVTPPPEGTIIYVGQQIQAGEAPSAEQRSETTRFTELKARLPLQVASVAAFFAGAGNCSTNVVQPAAAILCGGFGVAGGYCPAGQPAPLTRSALAIVNAVQACVLAYASMNADGCREIRHDFSEFAFYTGALGAAAASLVAVAELLPQVSPHLISTFGPMQPLRPGPFNR